MNSIIIFTDGASKGNPGPSSVGAAGFINTQNQKIEYFNLNRFKSKEITPLFTLSETIGIKTNNEAEYTALLKALIRIKDLQEKEKSLENSHIHIYMDSELIVKQMNREYKIKKHELKIIYDKITELTFFHDLQFTHIKRKFNQIADFLANEALKNV